MYIILHSIKGIRTMYIEQRGPPSQSTLKSKGIVVNDSTNQ